MKQFKGENIRNVSLLSHAGAGKTSLAESMLFNAQTTTRLGRIEEGTTTSLAKKSTGPRPFKPSEEEEPSFDASEIENESFEEPGTEEEPLTEIEKESKLLQRLN
jgi:hypothetical protein